MHDMSQTAARLRPKAIGLPLIVNGEEVPQQAIAAEAQNHRVPKGQPALAWRMAADALALRTLLLQEARRQGLTTEPEELEEGCRESEEEALIRGLLEAAIQVPKPSEAEIRAEWDRDPNRFRSRPLWEVSHLLCAFPTSDEAGQAAAWERASELAQEVQRQPADFAALAKRNSDCPSAAKGGSLGQVRPGDTLLAFEAAVATLDEGQITADPVMTSHGYHLIRLDARAEGRILPFEVVKAQIAEALEKTAWAKAARGYIAELVAQADISGANLGKT